MKLYDFELSGNCYKIRLFAALLGVPLERVAVDLRDGEHKRAPLIDMNPLGEVPILQDGELVLRDSQAILVYLARKYGGDTWLPHGAEQEARVMQWLSTAAYDLRRGPADARRGIKFGAAVDQAACVAHAERVLGILERHLTGREWLELGQATIADLAVFPYVALAPEGGVTLEGYTAIHAWIGRIKALPGFIPMPGI